jgi:rfaE bifunctional protein nucleotidyltransferase chain/domain
MIDKYNKSNWRVKKIVDLDGVKRVADGLREKGKKLVTVNGSFDLLHIGHLDQLEEAKKQGDILFVGVNSDKSIRGYKGSDRPFMSEEARAAMLAALECVDYVVVIDEEAPELQNVLLRAVKPDTHVNGAEYGEAEEWIEWPVMQDVGAKGYPAAKLNNLSTTDIVRKIQESKK